MAHQTHYEVLVKQDGRWEIHARYSQSEKEQAIEEAKTLDGQKHVQGIKVIQEIFDPEEGTSKEYNVYAPGQKKHHPPQSSTKKPSDKKVEGKAEATKHTKKKKKSRSFARILILIALISGFSAIVGAMFTWFVGMYLADFGITGNTQINILFIVFVSAFVISAIPMAMVFLGKEDD